MKLQLIEVCLLTTASLFTSLSSTHSALQWLFKYITVSDKRKPSLKMYKCLLQNIINVETVVLNVSLLKDHATEDWSNDGGNSLLAHRNKGIFFCKYLKQKMVILKGGVVSPLSYFYLFIYLFSGEGEAGRSFPDFNGLWNRVWNRVFFSSEFHQ